MPWERDLSSINPNPASLIKPFNTVPEYVDTRLQHFLIISNSRHIFPFWNAFTDRYQILKGYCYTLLNSDSSDWNFYYDTLFWTAGEIYTPLTPWLQQCKVICTLPTFDVHISLQQGSLQPGQPDETVTTDSTWHGTMRHESHNTHLDQSQHQLPSFSYHLEPNREFQTTALKTDFRRPNINHILRLFLKINKMPFVIDVIGFKKEDTLPSKI